MLFNFNLRILPQLTDFNNMNLLKFALIFTPLLTGCASITTGVNQTVSVMTRFQGAPIPGANCELFNDKGKWMVVTPGKADILKSAHDMVVRCELPGYEVGLTLLKPLADGVWGNLILGGAVGYAVDREQGAGFDYPAIITIDLIKTLGRGETSFSPNVVAKFPGNNNQP